MLRLRCPSRHFATAAASAMKAGPTVELVQQKISRLPTGFSVSSVELQIAKRTAEIQTLTTASCSSSFAVDQACQLLAKGTALTPDEFIALLKTVTADDVKKAASQLCAKLSMSAYGKVDQVPYLDQL
ncbi:hypothetical protein niasHS_001033 [Heterodera schachtii]|uniref:Uncharacterized protein n=1 Tax=Heterodera schachtii TaxID=97005 RepID=A0ABD2K814_HETSC